MERVCFICLLSIINDTKKRDIMSITATGHSLKMIVNFLDPKQSTKPIIEDTPLKKLIPIGPVDMPFERTSPESVGISSSYIESFLRELARDRVINMHSVLILKDGKVICDAVFGAQLANVAKHTFSACKSIVSLAIGMLYDEGILSLDEKISDIFEKECPSMSRFKTKQVTVENLLTMQSGMSFSESDSITRKDWLSECLSSGIKGEPGKVFSYNSLNTYLLGAIVAKKAGVSLSEFLEEKLFSPLHIKDYYWEKCPDGREKGGWGLYIKPEDMAKIGMLIMNGGIWDGERIISKKYVDLATSPHAKVPKSYGRYNYGYQIWVGRDINSFLFNGMLGQNTIGFKDNGILIVTNGGDSFNFQQSEYFEIVNRYFGGRFRDKAEENKRAEKSLEAYIKSLSDYNKVETAKTDFSIFTGKILVPDDPRTVSTGLLPNLLQVIENNYTAGIKSITISNRKDMLEIIYEENNNYNRFNVGLSKPEVCVLKFGNQRYHAAVQGKITSNEDDIPVLKIKIDFLETPCTRIIKLFHMGESMILRHDEMPGKKYVLGNIEEIQSGKNLLGFAIGNIDEEYIEYRINRIFSPEIKLKQL